MSEEELRSEKLLEEVVDLRTEVKILGARVDALVSLIDFLVESLPGDEEIIEPDE